jgi:hypothetical protein
MEHANDAQEQNQPVKNKVGDSLDMTSPMILPDAGRVFPSTE